jgi:hypothetical protein
VSVAEEWLGEPYPPGTPNVPQYVVTAAMERLVEQREQLDRTLLAMGGAVGFIPKRAHDVRPGNTIRLRGLKDWRVVILVTEEVPPDSQPLRRFDFRGAGTATEPADAWVDVHVSEPPEPF